MAGHAEAAQTLAVRIDSLRPTTTAYRASVVKGDRVQLAYKVSDALPGCEKAKVTLKLFKGATLKKTLRLGVRASDLKQSLSWRCTPGAATRSRSTPPTSPATSRAGWALPG